MKISVERYHYPIGQGMFSAQIVGYGNGSSMLKNKYVCVYDCGSIPDGKNAMGHNRLKEYVDELYGLSGGVIHTLFISHFDDDHVNGLKHIFSRGFDVKKIIIPCMSRLQTIHSIWEISREGGEFRIEAIDNARVYVEIMINKNISEGDDPIRIPENTIVEKSAEIPRIENVNVSNSKFSQKSIWEFTHFTLTPGYDGDLERQFYEKVFFDKACLNNPLHYLVPDQFDYILHGAEVTLAGAWESSLRNRIDSKDRDDISDVMKEINKSMRDLYTDFFKSLANEHKYSLNRNKASLILYSGISDNLIKTDCCKKSYCSCIPVSFKPVVKVEGRSLNLQYEGDGSYEFLQDPKQGKLESFRWCGWLGTGDAQLNTKDYIDELEGSLGKLRMSRIEEITAPHHGSRYNSNEDFYEKFRRDGEVVCIIHSDVNRKNPHPHGEVVGDMKRNSIIPVNVTLDADTKYLRKIYIDVCSRCLFYSD